MLYVGTDDLSYLRSFEDVMGEILKLIIETKKLFLKSILFVWNSFLQNETYSHHLLKKLM